MFDIGFQELVIIFVIALLVIGPDKLPEFGRKVARWVAEIKRGVNLAKSQIEKEINPDILISETSAQPLRKDDEDENIMNRHDITDLKI
ncbi:MAG: Sec-independent protein translocase protein TatB [Thermodesulfovibrionales bacterium]